MSYSLSLKNKLAISVADQFEVYLAMRYQNPSLDDVLESLRQNNFKKIIVIFLHAQSVKLLVYWYP